MQRTAASRLLTNAAADSAQLAQSRCDHPGCVNPAFQDYLASVVAEETVHAKERWARIVDRLVVQPARHTWFYEVADDTSAPKMAPRCRVNVGSNAKTAQDVIVDPDVEQKPSTAAETTTARRDTHPPHRGCSWDSPRTLSLQPSLPGRYGGLVAPERQRALVQGVEDDRCHKDTPRSVRCNGVSGRQPGYQHFGDSVRSAGAVYHGWRVAPPRTWSYAARCPSPRPTGGTNPAAADRERLSTPRWPNATLRYSPMPEMYSS